MSLREPGKSRIPDLQRLRWLGVRLPVLGIALLFGVLEIVTEIVTFHFHRPWIAHLTLYLIVMGFVSAGAYFFSRYIFRQVEQQQEEIRRRNQELAALNAVGAVVNEALGLNEILVRALDKVLEVTGADSGEIFLWQPETEDLELAAFRGLFPEAFQQVTRFKLSEGYPGWVGRTGKSILIRDLPKDPRFIRARVREAGFQSYAGVPLRSKGKVVGVLGIAALDPRRLTQADVELLDALGNQIGVAIENARLYTQLAEMGVLEERQRIAREIHDGVAQEVGYLYLKIGELEARSPASSFHGEVRLLKQAAAAVYEEVRQAIFGLKALASPNVELVPTLAEYLCRFSEQTGIPVELKVADEKATRLVPRVEVQLIRIIQEALANVRKHAQARQAWVIFDTEGERVKVTIEDNGRGFDPQEAARRGKASFGLQTMRERVEGVGGDFSIEAGLGQGTRVIARFPWRPDE